MPSALFLTQRLPFPPIKGEKIRPLRLLKYLGQSFDVYLGCLVDDPADWKHVDTVRALCRDAYFAPLDRRRAAFSCLAGLFSREPLSVTFFRNADLARWVRRVLDEARPEVVFVCSSNMAPYVLDVPKRERVRLVDLADVDSEKWRAYAQKTRGPMRLVYHREWRLVSALERRIARECDFSTFVSEAEAALFRKMMPDYAERIRGVSSGVDHEYFDPGRTYPVPYDALRPTYVFTGTMDYPPNVDAVVWFATEVFPVVRHRVPMAQFYIVGSNPAPAVLRLGDIEGIHVTGRVPDVRPYLAHAVAGVAPMRIARGIQNKVLEAMAMGKPVIVTPEALEGIDAEPERELLVASSAEPFAAAACRVATGPKGAEIGLAARRRVVSQYDWAERLRGFDALLGSGQGHATPHSSADRSLASIA